MQYHPKLALKIAIAVAHVARMASVHAILVTVGRLAKCIAPMSVHIMVIALRVRVFVLLVSWAQIAQLLAAATDTVLVITQAHAFAIPVGVVTIAL